MGLGEVISGVEWIAIVVSVAGVGFGWWLVLSVQPDMRIPEKGENDNEQAVDMFVRLVNSTRRSLVIHDDGNNDPKSVYNSDKVINAIEQRIRRQRIEVRCLFNDPEPIKLAELAETDGCQDHIHIWYVEGDRPDPDIHYKIVDDGRMIHLSNHGHRADERGYVLYTLPRWAIGSRRRISQQYREHFEQGLKGATSEFQPA